MEWFQAVETITPHVVKITTPQGSGTGFLVSRGNANQICALATAAHVVNHAHYWEQPIRITHTGNDESVVLRSSERAIILDEERDTAAVLFTPNGISLPDTPLPLIEENYHLKVGNPIGWLGYPGIGLSQLCFFTGTTSAFVEDTGAYLVDGVAINGVSGGPAFTLYSSGPEIIGVVSAYIPNRLTGETLPGLGIVRDVRQFHDVIRNIKSLEEAKAQEKPPADSPPPAGPESSTASSSRRPA